MEIRSSLMQENTEQKKSEESIIAEGEGKLLVVSLEIAKCFFIISLPYIWLVFI